jgi:hypothetical protein
MSSLVLGVADILSGNVWQLLDENGDPDLSRKETQRRWMVEGYADLFFRAIFECFTHTYCCWVNFPAEDVGDDALDRGTTWDLLACEEVAEVVPDGFGYPKRIKTNIQKADAGPKGSEGTETQETKFWEFGAFHLFTPWQIHRSHEGWSPIFGSWGPDIHLDQTQFSMAEFDENEGNGVGILVTPPLASDDKTALQGAMEYTHWLRLLHFEVLGDASKCTYGRTAPTQVDYAGHREELRKAFAAPWRVTASFVGMDPTGALSASTMDAEQNRARMKALFMRFVPLIRWMVTELMGEDEITQRIMPDFELRESKKELEEVDGLKTTRITRSPISYGEMREKLGYEPLLGELSMYNDYHPMLGNHPMDALAMDGMGKGGGEQDGDRKSEKPQAPEIRSSGATMQVSRSDSLHRVRIATPGEVNYAGRKEKRPASVLKSAVERKPHGVPVGIGEGLHGPEVLDKDAIGWAIPMWDEQGFAVASVDIDPHRLAEIEAKRPDLADLIEQVKSGEFMVSPAFLARIRSGIETNLDLRSIVITPTPRDERNRTDS